MALAKGTFSWNVMTLMMGTAVAQALMLALAPLLSRIYTPEDFGIYGLYAAVITIISVAVSLNYELAIVLPKTDGDAINVAALSVIAAVGVGLLTLVFLCVCPLALIYPQNPKAISAWVWVLPLSAVALGVAGTLEAWCTRMKLFSQSSGAKIVRGATTAAVQVTGGYRGWGSLGLIYGAVLGDMLAAAAMYGMAVRRGLLRHLKQVSWVKIKEMAVTHADFPIYSCSQSLLNAISLSAPAFVLTYFYGIKVAGYYLLGIKLIQVPADLVSRSFRQVFYQKAAETHHAAGDLRDLFTKSTVRLLALTIIPTVVLFLFAPALFKFTLGATWETAGEYSRWLALWIGVNFANVPAICCYRILKMQKTLFWIYTFYLLARMAALLGGANYFPAEVTVILFAAVGLVFNTVIIGIIWRRLAWRSS